ncbi:MAG TPA: hypothetical protein VHC90_07310 [Bryobacteraceae bacterium]|nr:hypothetical protein [Bryobacteraceae bacterium]
MRTGIDIFLGLGMIAVGVFLLTQYLAPSVRRRLRWSTKGGVRR